MQDFAGYDDARRIARRRLPRGIFDYIDRGSEAETSLQDLRHSFDLRRFVPRVLPDPMVPDCAIHLFGARLSQPFIVAPTAFAGLVWPDGEIALARAAESFGIPFCAATEALTDISTIAAARTAPPWFQLYLWEKFDLTLDLVRKAQSLGVETLVVTVDTPVLPIRDYNSVNGFDVPFRPGLRNLADLACHPGWIARVLLPGLWRGQVPDFGNYPPEWRSNLLSRGRKPGLAHHPALSWDLMRQLRQEWPGHLLIKGILHPADAGIAADLGADGIVVSSHGGRNFDSAITPLAALPEIAAAVGGRVTILADSGIRRGSDIFKLLHAGADAVMIGRAMLYATACGGMAGAERMMTRLGEELATTMTLAGCSDIAAIREARALP